MCKTNKSDELDRYFGGNSMYPNSMYPMGGVSNLVAYLPVGKCAKYAPMVNLKLRYYDYGILAGIACVGVETFLNENGICYQKIKTHLTSNDFEHLEDAGIYSMNCPCRFDSK